MPRRYLVRKSATGRWIAYFLAPVKGPSDTKTRLVYKVMGWHSTMRDAIDGIYE